MFSYTPFLVTLPFPPIKTGSNMEGRSIRPGDGPRCEEKGISIFAMETLQDGLVMTSLAVIDITEQAFGDKDKLYLSHVQFIQVKSIYL